MKRVTISINVSQETYDRLSESKDIYFEEAEKKDPEIRKGWKGFFLYLFKQYEGRE